MQESTRLVSLVSRPTGKTPSPLTLAKTSQAKQKKRGAKLRSPKKKSRKRASSKIAKDKDSDQSESESERKDRAGVDQDENTDKDEVEGDGNEDATTGVNLNPSVYIKVALDPNCSPSKTSSTKPLGGTSRRVIENGRRVLTKAKPKMAKLGKVPESQESGVAGKGLKRKGDKADEAQMSRKKERMDSDEESDDALDAEQSSKGKAKERGKRSSSLKTGGKEGRATVRILRNQLDTAAGQRGAVGKSRGKATWSRSGENHTTRKGFAQDPPQKTGERAGHRGVSNKKSKADEEESPSGSSNNDDSSNGGALDDNPGSTSTSEDPKSKAARKGKGPAGGFKLRKRTAEPARKLESDSAKGRATVGLDSANLSTAEGGSSQKNVDSESSATKAPAFTRYVRRGRGRPSLFQTFQSALNAPDNASATTSAVGSGRTSPAMKVLLKETTVRAVTRVSLLTPPPGDEIWKEKLKSVDLLDSVNDHIASPLQTVFVKLDESSDVMNVLIVFKSLEDNMVFQCTFCPFTDFSANVVSDHVRQLHVDCMFAATRTPMPTGDVLYLFCRHCSFVTHDRISMWIHFEICHGIADIVYGSDVTEVTPQVTRRLVLTREQQAIVPSVYQCLDCDLLVADNRHIAEHAVKNHEEDTCYRGCFAKAKVINKPKSAPIQTTYSQLLSDEYVDQRKEVFICVRCSYIAYTEFLAICHHIMSHLELRMVYLCNVEGCGNREASSEAAILHTKATHADVNTRILRGTVTLVSQSTGDPPQLAECHMLERKGGGGKKKAVAQKESVAQPAEKARTTEKPASRGKGKVSAASAGESTSDESSHERQSNASSGSKNTDKRKAKQTTSKHGHKHN